MGYKMKVFIQWFFIVGSFAFLYWYMPEALKDNKVMLVEMATIGINVLCFIINFANFVSARLEKADLCQTCGITKKDHTIELSDGKKYCVVCGTSR